MIASAMHERMVKRLECAKEEALTLKEALAAATGSSKIRFTAEQRRRLALKGKELTPKERTECCQVVRPGTPCAARRGGWADGGIGHPGGGWSGASA